MVVTYRAGSRDIAGVQFLKATVHIHKYASDNTSTAAAVDEDASATANTAKSSKPAWKKLTCMLMQF